MASAERQALLSELARLEARRAGLGLEIERLGTKRGQEEEIREKLGLALPGEHVVTIIGLEGTSTVSVEEEKNWFWSLIDSFLGLWKD